jgi:hypothetical protein
VVQRLDAQVTPDPVGQAGGVGLGGGDAGDRVHRHGAPPPASGRDRRAASHAERARLNATRAIRAAMANLARANPALGRHLAATIRTGRYCCYVPDPRAPITWQP